MDNLTLRLLPALFADQHAMRNVMRGMHGRQAGIDTGGLATALMIFCLFFVCAWGFARVFIKPENGSIPSSPQALFRELCRAHGLSRGNWWLLWRLARYHRLGDPALLFLEPRWLEPAVCGEAWKGHEPRLRELRLMLFAGLASPHPGEREA